jgi:hypothetical protein
VYERIQAKLDRGDVYERADRDDEEARAEGDASIACVDELALFIGREIERVPLRAESVVLGRIWQALGHLQYQVAVRKFESDYADRASPKLKAAKERAARCTR